MSEHLTWEQILAMDEATLNLASATHVEGLVPVTSRLHAQTGCTHQAPDGSLVCPDDYTASWEHTMTLAWWQGVSLRIDRPGVAQADLEEDYGLPRQGVPPNMQDWSVDVETPEHARMTICRLALWRAVNQAKE